MYQVKIISAGVKKIAKIEKLYNYLGPLCLTYGNDKDGFPVPIARFDNIESIEVVNDLSTRKIVTSSEGASVTKAKTGNMVKRAVIGGVLTGGAGAVIGGVTGTRNTETVSTSTSSEVLNYLVTLQAKFKDGKIITFTVDNPEITELLFSHIGTEYINDEELAKLKILAVQEKEKQRRLAEDEFKDQKITEKAEELAKKNLINKKPWDDKMTMLLTIIPSVIISIGYAIFSSLTTFTLIAFLFKIILSFIVVGICIFIFVGIIVLSQQKEYERLFKEEVFNQRQNIKMQLSKKVS